MRTKRLGPIRKEFRSQSDPSPEGSLVVCVGGSWPRKGSDVGKDKLWPSVAKSLSKCGRICWQNLEKFARIKPKSLSQFTVMSSANKLAQKLSITATAWPKDPFRPNMQLANFLQSLATHPNLTPNAVEAALTLQSNAIMQKVRFMTSHHSRDLRCILSVPTITKDAAASFTTPILHPSRRSTRKEFARHWPSLVEGFLWDMVVVFRRDCETQAPL